MGTEITGQCPNLLSTAHFVVCSFFDWCFQLQNSKREHLATMGKYLIPHLFPCLKNIKFPCLAFPHPLFQYLGSLFVALGCIHMHAVKLILFTVPLKKNSNHNLFAIPSTIKSQSSSQRSQRAKDHQLFVCLFPCCML